MKSGQSQRSNESILCAKCQHVNPPGSNTCEKCESHLWVVCHHCGHRNRRVDAHCTECKGRMHRTIWKRVSKKLFGNRQNINLWQIVILVIAVWVAYKTVIFFSEYQAPPAE